MSVLRTTFVASIAVLFVGSTAIGCFVDHDDDDHGHGHGHDDDGHHAAGENPYYTTVDRGATLSTDLGEGAGFFVEYAEGGNWTVWTSCDANLTGQLCFFEASIVAFDSNIHDAAGEGLEAYDTFDLVGADALYVSTETGYESDRVTFTTDPGALVRVRLTLDGISAPSYVIWLGNEVVQNGAPRMPVVFQPDAP